MKTFITKKVMLFTLLVLLSFTMTDAQNLKGRLFAGGSLGFDLTSGTADINGNSYSNPKAYQAYNITPSVGYYMTDKWAIGLQIGYSFWTYTSIFPEAEYTSTNTTKTFNIAPLLRYTMPITDKLGFNLNITIPYSYSDGSYSPTANISLPNGDKIITTSYGLNVNPSFQWFVKENITIIGSLGTFSYSYIKTDISGIHNSNNVTATAQSNNLKLSLTTGLGLGVSFYFGGNKSTNNTNNN